MKLEKIFENENIIIYQDNKGWDFAYDIENKKDNKIIIRCWNEYNEEETFEINDWIGFFPNQKSIIDNILNGNYEIIEE